MLINIVLFCIKFIYPFHISMYKIKFREEKDFIKLIKYFAIFSIVLFIEYILDYIFIN